MDKKDKKTKKYSAIGLRIKERMDAIPISQEELGKAAGISQSAISQILSNENPSKHLPKLSILLNSHFEWLAYGRGPKTAQELMISPPTQNTLFRPEESMTSVEAAAKFLSYVMEGLRDLPPETRDKAEAMIREALKEEDEVKKMDRSKVGA